MAKVRKVRFYAYEGYDEEKFAKLREMAAPGERGFRSEEPVQQSVLEDPRWRREFWFSVPESLELIMLLGSMRREDGFEFVEGGPPDA